MITLLLLSTLDSVDYNSTTTVSTIDSVVYYSITTASTIDSVVDYLTTTQYVCGYVTICTTLLLTDVAKKRNIFTLVDSPRIELLFSNGRRNIKNFSSAAH